MRTASQTHVGKIRSVNEDRVAVQTNLNGFTLAIVADGMGGHQAGDIASQKAIERIYEELAAIHTAMTPEECMEAIRRSILAANEHVFELAASHEEYFGMGTTVVLALAAEQYFYIGHIGDSRAYLSDGETIRQLTEDHSLVNELVKNGQISEEEANHHPRRNVLIRALGTDRHVEADVHQFAWNEQDRLLLCSDGLSNLIENDEILRIVASDSDVQTKADLLVEQALEAGGGDNISLVLLENMPFEAREGGTK